MENPAAVLIDQDGTLVDSEPYWFEAEFAVVDTFGGSWSAEQAEALVGGTLLGGAQQLQAAGAQADAETLVDFMVDHLIAATRARTPWRPGAQKLLTALTEAGIPCALVTSSYRKLADVVAELAGIHVVVAGDEVEHGKPHPEPYLTAAERLGVDPRRCVAIEDSRPGVASALASGAHTIAVPCVVPIPAQPGLNRVTSLERLDLPTLRRIVAGEVIDEL